MKAKTTRAAKKAWVLLYLTSMALYTSAQHGDSLKLQVLEEIVFEGVKQEGDTLQNFYRANASATTETILSRMKGVTLIRRGAYGQEPVIRGLQGGQLNVTIDGMKIFGACTDKMDPVTIYTEPQNLSAIQAMTGTQGAEFGSTFGGAVNMKLDAPNIGKKGVTGLVGMDYQSAAGAFNGFSRMNIGRRKNAYRFSATYRKSGNYRAGSGTKVSYSQYEKINLTASGKWTLGKYDTLQADALVDHGNNLGFPALPMDVTKASAGIFALGYYRAAPWHFLHHLQAKVYHNNIAHHMSDSHRTNIEMPMDMPGESQTTGMFAQADVPIFPNRGTLMKVEYFVNRLIGEMTMYPREGSPMYMQTAPRSSRQNTSLFLSHRIHLDDHNKTEFSFRGDLVTDRLHRGLGKQQWEVFYPNLTSSTQHFASTFSILYTHHFSNKLNFGIRSGFGERVATLNERFGYYLFNRFDGYDYIGDPAINNETSWSSEVTVDYFGKRIECQVTPFYQRIDNYIMGEFRDELIPMTPGAHGVKQNTNLVGASLAGADVTLLARPRRYFQFIATLKYTYGRNSEGQPLPLMPPLKSVASLRYSPGNIHVQAEWEWAASQSRVNAPSAEMPTPSWSILSLRTGWKVNSFLECNAGVENLLDENYREHLDWGGIPRQGWNCYLNAIYIF